MSPFDAGEPPGGLALVLARLEAAGLDPRRAGRGWQAFCPCHQDQSPSLAVKDNGGGWALVTCFAGCPRGAVLAALGVSPEALRGAGPLPPPAPPRGLTDGEADLLDRVHSDLLLSLLLSPGHRRALLHRGLSGQAILAGGYRSLTWRDGLVIPVRDHLGRVVGCQVRNGGQDWAGPRYHWWQVAPLPPGTPAPVHSPLGVPEAAVAGGWVRVTEGPLKADLSWHLDPQAPCLGIPGVSAWQGLLPLLSTLRVGRVELALDADWKVKPQVQCQLVRLGQALRQAGLVVRVLDWPLQEGKGLDDLLAGGGRPGVLADLPNMPAGYSDWEGTRGGLRFRGR